MTVIVLVLGLTVVVTPGAEAAQKCSGWKVRGAIAVKACTSHSPVKGLIHHHFRVRNVGVEDIRVTSFGAAYINGHSAGKIRGDNGATIRPGSWRGWSATSTRLKGKRYTTKAWAKYSGLPNASVTSPAIKG
ncbi:hypothetical protein [Nocardioides lijunqiniae]|uniref:hypothetical protein n=1 Tax=Nocardioides lijunqiniae TaxID=2760832 RepID=UPI001878EF3D|nr:hypothetical protein [Nocardioides lijunqiniae]